MSRAFGLLALLALGACVRADPETEGGIIAMTDADYLAAYGLPDAAILQINSRKNDDGTYTEAVHFLTAEVTAAQLAAAPGVLCAGNDAVVISSRIVAPTSEFIDIPMSQVLIAECTAAQQGAAP